jgi:hypothetical protein
MTTLRMTEKGLQEIDYNEGDIMIFLSGKPLAGALNQLPGGIEKKMHFYRGNSANAIPFQFASLEKAMEAFKQVRWERYGKKENAKVFSGNNWLGYIVNDEFEMLDKPIPQLL